jgi:hypothetical protein
MKINFDIDLTPEEARKLMGLPDLEPMQKAVVKQIQDKIMQEVENVTDVEHLYSRFFPFGLQSMEHMQKFFSSMLSIATADTTKKTSKK